jgi:hypothetical protein
MTSLALVRLDRRLRGFVRQRPMTAACAALAVGLWFGRILSRR